MLRAVALITAFLIALTSSAYAHHFGHARAAYDRGDYDTAFRDFRVLAEHGHPVAQANLSLLYFWGTGAPLDYAMALEWALRAAAQGHAVAQTQLGYIYLNADGETRDLEEAAKWYRRAAEQGFDVAQTTLGTMYYQGIGVAQDYTEAVKWLRLAAKQSNADALAKLGVAYLRGDGVSKDYTQAYVSLSIAQERGNQNVASILKFLVPQMTVAQILRAERLIDTRQNNWPGATGAKQRDHFEQEYIVGRELYPHRYRSGR